MEFRQLEVFVSTVNHKSFSGAAEDLFLSQPTVSAHIHALEKELRLPLIQRTTKSFQVTSHGLRLYDYAVALLQLQKKAVRDLTDCGCRELHIGASSVPGHSILPQVLVRYRQCAPDVRFYITSSESLDIIQKVADGNLDAGLVGTTADCGCTFHPFASDQLVIAAPNTPHYQQLKQNGAPLATLLREPILLRTEKSGTMQETEHFLQSLGISPEELNLVARMNDAEELRSSVAAGLGISILSARMVREPERQGKLLVFPLGEYAWERRFYVVQRTGSRLSQAAEEFIQFLLDLAEKEAL